MSPRRIFMTRAFSRWFRKSSLGERDLAVAVKEMSCGLIDARLGGHIYKKRVAITGRGKRGSTRVLIGSNLCDRWFFLLGFAKNERGELIRDELLALRKWAAVFLSLDVFDLAELLEIGELTEICHEEKSHSQ